MTRTQTHAYGVVTPSTRQLSLEAMLRAFVWLVSNLVSMLRTILNHPTRDWHTGTAGEDQIPTSNDKHQKETDTPQPSFTGKRKARIPGIPVASTQGTTPYSLRTLTRDARDKPEHGSIDDAQSGRGPLGRVPREGGDPVTMRSIVSQPACAPRTDQTPAVAWDTGHQTYGRKDDRLIPRPSPRHSRQAAKPRRAGTQGRHTRNRHCTQLPGSCFRRNDGSVVCMKPA